MKRNLLRNVWQSPWTIGVIALAVILCVPMVRDTASGFEGLTDEAVAVWQHRDSPASPTGWDIWYSVVGRPTPGSPSSTLAWHAGGGTAAAPIANLPGDDKNPHIGINAGAATAVWQHQHTNLSWDILYSDLVVVNGVPTWSTPAPIATLAGDDYDPNIAVDANQNAVAVWVHRHSDESRELFYSVRTGATWSAAAPIGVSGGQASLPEVTITSGPSVGGSLNHLAVAAWSDILSGTHRMFYSIFNGVTWTTPAQIESAATGIGLSIGNVVFANYVASDPDSFGAFGRLGITGDGAGNVMVVWGGGPILLGNSSPGVVGAILNVAANTWTPMFTPFGSRFIGVGGCENPDDALTTGGGDFVGVFNFAGSIEDTQRVAGAFTSEAFSWGSVLNDQRPSDIAISATEMIGVNWGAPVGASSEISWSVGTVAPTDVSWLPVLNIVPGGLTGEDMFPELASPFASSLISGFTLAPGGAVNPVGTPHTVTATATVNGLPISGVTVSFTVTGANSASGSGLTDATGQVTFTYTGASPGTDTITATATLIGVTVTATVTKQWTGPPPPEVPPRTLGFWKNHPEEIQRVLSVESPIHFAEQNFFMPEQVQAVLDNATSRDATVMLFAQALATLLNVKPPDVSFNASCIAPILAAADAFLHDNPAGSGLTGGRAATPEQLALRAQALALKDQLDAYNNGTGTCFP